MMLALGRIAAVALPMTLTGEHLEGLNVADLSAQCNRDHSGVFSYTVSGIAAGPYGGTFTERITVTVGPPLGKRYGPNSVAAFSARFTVTSRQGVILVTGTKASIGDGSGLALCQSGRGGPHYLVQNLRTYYRAT